MVYIEDLKSSACNGHAGSSPARGTILKHIDGTGFVPASRAIINEVVLSACFNMVKGLITPLLESGVMTR